MDKLKICIIGNDYKQQFPLIGYGGIETAVENLACGIHAHYEDRIQLSVITPKILNHNEVKYPFKIIETDEMETSVSRKHVYHYISEVKNIIQNAETKPDVIWSYSSWSAQALADLNIPMITTMMDSGGWIDNKFVARPNVYYRFASKFIYDETFVKTKSQSSDTIARNSFYHFTGVGDDEYDLNVNKDGSLLWVGGLNWGMQGKGLDVFLELSKRLPDREFIAYGIGDDIIADELTQISNTQPNFHFGGELKRGRDHSNAFKNASMFVFPTKISEAFGYTWLEAITKGTPVLTSTTGAPQEFVNFPNAGLATDDIEEMINFITTTKNYEACFEFSKKYHVSHEIDFLYNKTKELFNL